MLPGAYFKMARCVIKDANKVVSAERGNLILLNNFFKDNWHGVQIEPIENALADSLEGVTASNSREQHYLD